MERLLRWRTYRVTGKIAVVAYQSFDVPVTGGSIHVGRWGSGRAVVVGAHGLTGTHMNFEAIADQLGDAVTLLAVDLRGRGKSTASGPYGMARHGEDLIAVLDYAGAAEALARRPLHGRLRRSDCGSGSP